MIPMYSSAVSSVVVLKFEEQCKLLMLKRCRLDGGHWNHICGSLKGNETAVQAIVREIHEETGLKDFSLFNGETIEQFFQPIKNRILLMPLLVAIVDTMPDVVLNEEHTEFRWCSLEEALDLSIYDGQKAVYRHVWRLFVNNELSKKTSVPFEPFALHN